MRDTAMSILGVIVRSRPLHCPMLRDRLRALDGVEVADLALEDGRAVVVIEDTAQTNAAATMATIAGWPEVLNTSLVYEYSGPDSPAPAAVQDYRDWRRGPQRGTSTDTSR